MTDAPPADRREPMAELLVQTYEGGITWGDIDAILALADATRPEPHCPTCICGKRAPVQGDYREHPSGTVAWWEYLEAYTAYATRYGHNQSPERLAERAEFGYKEMTTLLGHEPTTWTVRGGR